MQNTDAVTHGTGLSQRCQRQCCANPLSSRLRNSGYPIDPCHTCSQEELRCGNRLPIQQAYQELGYPEGDFNSALKKAILSLLDTPELEDRIYIEKRVLYVMEDPALENLAPAQKQLLRMGPDNRKAVQAKLRELAQALGFLD